MREGKGRPGPEGSRERKKGGRPKGRRFRDLQKKGKGSPPEKKVPFIISSKKRSLEGKGKKSQRLERREGPTHSAIRSGGGKSLEARTAEITSKGEFVGRERGRFATRKRRKKEGKKVCVEKHLY